MNGEAKYLLDNELLNGIFDRMERDAIELAISARLGDDEMRRTALGEVRAIRSVRQNLRQMLSNNPAAGVVV